MYMGRGPRRGAARRGPRLPPHLEAEEDERTRTPEGQKTQTQEARPRAMLGQQPWRPRETLWSVLSNSSYRMTWSRRTHDSIWSRTRPRPPKVSPLHLWPAPTNKSTMCLFRRWQTWSAGSGTMRQLRSRSTMRR